MPSFLYDINFLDDVYPVFLLFGIYFHRKKNKMNMFKRYDLFMAVNHHFQSERK